MTILFLVGLLSAWAGYFVYCGIKDSGIVLHGRNGIAAFNRNLGALSEASTNTAGPRPTKQLPAGMQAANGSRVLLNHPRSSQEAGRRRRNVMIGLIGVAVAALISTFAIGTVGLVIHFLADLALLGFASLAVHWRHRSAEHEMRTLLLNHGQPLAAAPHNPAVIPVQQAVHAQRIAIR